MASTSQKEENISSNIREVVNANGKGKTIYIDSNAKKTESISTTMSYLLEGSKKNYFFHSCCDIPWNDWEKLKEFVGICYKCGIKIKGVPIPIPVTYDYITDRMTPSAEVYCDFDCAITKLFLEKSHDMHVKIMALHQMAIKIFGYTKEIAPRLDQSWVSREQRNEINYSSSIFISKKTENMTPESVVLEIKKEKPRGGNLKGLKVPRGKEVEERKRKLEENQREREKSSMFNQHLQKISITKNNSPSLSSSLLNENGNDMNVQSKESIDSNVVFQNVNSTDIVSTENITANTIATAKSTDDVQMKDDGLFLKPKRISKKSKLKTTPSVTASQSTLPIEMTKNEKPPVFIEPIVVSPVPSLPISNVAANPTVGKKITKKTKKPNSIVKNNANVNSLELETKKSNIDEDLKTPISISEEITDNQSTTNATNDDIFEIKVKEPTKKKQKSAFSLFSYAKK